MKRDRDSKPRSESRPKTRSKSPWPYMALTAVIVVILGFFLPTYMLGVEDENGNRHNVVTVYEYKVPDLDFTKRSLEAVKGLNESSETEDTARDTQQGIEENTNRLLPVCYLGSLIFVVLNLAMVLKTFQGRSFKKRSRSMVVLGSLIVGGMVLILVFMTFIPGMFMEGQNLPYLVESMEESPLGGTWDTEVDGHAFEVFWGVGMGVWLQLVGGMLIIMSGVGEYISGIRRDGGEDREDEEERRDD